MKMNRRLSRMVELRVLQHLTDQKSVFSDHLGRIQSPDAMGSIHFHTGALPTMAGLTGPLASHRF